ncbi:uncharacterized protein LOC120282370 [Dioscorea cayenensis subsp. rotundata]|uniref:Uncharacterized protein LOC120282370 n=1 Tax=Dioscorea cayennensis subsp. rotundata TaxID=55577 RepID=A0AB40CYL8_DIOCR|nr:uncharacterized protein LOC120282370 [Dioscorea cayenensis subsp. rotundata]XP_039145111.1 uncharacterized protein LOC120282370 [Dioscorea cayenensis subsp. rotundata]
MLSYSSSSSGPVTFSSTISTDIPLYEPPGQASFDDYIQDRPRVFNAMFPDKRRSKRLNDEEWQIQMLPIQFLFATVMPVVVMRLKCRSLGKNYPSGVPLHATRVLDLQATRWELRGLENMYVPSHFSLSVQGALYAEKKRSNGGGNSRLKGHLKMSISVVLPAILAIVPENILRVAAETVLKRLVEKMKQEVDGALLSDFQSFRKEMLMTKRAQAIASAAHRDRDTSSNQL